MTKFMKKVSSLVLPRFFLYVAILGGLAVLAAGDSVAATAASPAMAITVDEQLISAELVDAPLIEVLQRLQQEFGFKAYFHGDLSEPITASFAATPLLKVLQLLTANQSLSVATRADQIGADPADAHRLAEIWVLSRSSKEQPPAINAAVPMLANTGDAESFAEDSVAQVVDAQMAQLLASEEDNKQQTIARLAAISDSSAVMAMAAFTRDVDAEIRRMSVSAISSVNSAESTIILGQVLRDEPEAQIRRIAVEELGARKSDPTAQTLLAEALNDSDTGLKELARQLLAL